MKRAKSPQTHSHTLFQVIDQDPRLLSLRWDDSGTASVPRFLGVRSPSSTRGNWLHNVPFSDLISLPTPI